MSTNGTRQSSKGLREIVRATMVTREVAQAGMIWSPQNTVSEMASAEGERIAGFGAWILP